jgi:hypothetical protein
MALLDHQTIIDCLRGKLIETQEWRERAKRDFNESIKDAGIPLPDGALTIHLFKQ